MTTASAPFRRYLMSALFFPLVLFAQPFRTGPYLGGGLNYADITINNSIGNDPTRRDPGYHLQLGLAFTPRLALQLEYATYGSNDVHNCATFGTARAFRTKLLLLSLRIGKTFYLRPGAGLGFHDAIFGNYSGDQCLGTEVGDEGGPAWGIAAGIRQQLRYRLSLALEGGFWNSYGEDSTNPRRILAVQLVGNFYLR